ncbi:hypothetical protein HH1059_04230 [Halorhodospira halochloris]|uniref:Uncharacterized protein n=1 Tax=Halorhodospira halochloris TaxID=1052 RepID=A0A2Z6EZD0_HALHR|nr:hypothetical protein [Halorhodospira halochloris]MBK1652673.1 hypothetical protein [Halorhodospira halochloris]BBE10991.1 hypothetical protein HH1059_04230 [Halorhodospira halochloris]
MLFISLPKAAAGAFTNTLAVAHRVQRTTTWSSFATAPSNYKELSLIHKSCRDYSTDFLDELTGGELRHLHIPPTENNVNLLRKTKKCVITRNFKDVPGAYFRETRHHFRKKPTVFYGAQTEHDFYLAAEKSGLLEELQSFVHGWQSACDENTLIIDHSDIVSDRFQDLLETTEDHFRLEPSGTMKLRSARNTRETGIIKPIRKNARRLARFLNKI